MLNVNDATKNTYMNENVPKYITISFPDGDHADITNENIVEESMKLTQSICEESTPIAGGCNSSQFEIVVGDVNEDLTGKKINVTLSCKDPDYRGAWQENSIYVVGSVVKNEDLYYECITDTSCSLNLEFSTAIVPNAGVVATASSIPVLGYSVIKINISDKGLINWSKLRVNIVQIKNGATSPLATRSISESGVYAIKIVEGCDVISINIVDSSGLSVYNTLLEHWDISLINNVETGNNGYWQEIYGYVDTSDTDDIKLFSGTIYSAKKQQNKRLKTIVAYDLLYDLGKVDITDWFNSEETGIVDIHYKGTWVSGTAYKKGDIVHYIKRPSNNEGVVYDYYYKYKVDMPDKMLECNPWMLYQGGYNTGFGIIGTNMIERTTATKKTITLKALRDKLFSYLAAELWIEQENTTLPLDSLVLWIGKYSEKNLTALKLLTDICNLNGCFGGYNASDETFNYVFIKETNDVVDLSDLYEMDGVDYGEQQYTCKGFNLINNNGEVVAGALDDSYMHVNYNYLVSKNYSKTVLLQQVQSKLVSRLNFVPTKVKTVGLPFLQVGDSICYTVKEYKTENNELIEQEHIINTIVMERVLSGIQALTDDIDAKYE